MKLKIRQIDNVVSPVIIKNNNESILSVYIKQKIKYIIKFVQTVLSELVQIEIEPSTPTNFSATQNTFIDRIRLSWDAALYAQYYNIFKNEEFLTRITTTTYDDFFGDQGTTYSYTLVAGNTRGESTQTNSIIGWKKLSAPTNLQASDSLSSLGITLTWSGVSGATAYKIFRKPTSSSLFSQIGLNTTTNYNDTSASFNTIYDYSVKSSFSLGDSDFSNSDTGSLLLPFPETPNNVSASDGMFEDKINIQWSPSNYSDSYNVYRGVNKLTTTQNTFYSDTTAIPGILHDYSVSGNNSRGEGPPSSIDSGWRKLSAPTNLQASDGTYEDKITITWDSVFGGTTYDVFKMDPAPPTLLASVQNTEYNDTTSPTGTYAVKAFSVLGSSDFSNSDTGFTAASPPTGAPPAIPTGLVATTGTYTDKVDLQWNTMSGISGYYVYRYSGDGNENPTPNELKIITLDSSTNTYSDTQIIPGYFYEYSVSAHNFYGEGITASKVPGWSNLQTPLNLTASLGNFSDKIYLSWNLVEGHNVNYNIYKKIHDAFSLLDATPNTDYFDLTPGFEGITQTYRIAAFNNLTQSPNSIERIGFKGITATSSITASYGEFTDKITVVWNTIPGAINYEIYKTYNENTTLLGITSNNKFSDINIDYGVLIGYSVRGIIPNLDHFGPMSGITYGWRKLQPPNDLITTQGVKYGNAGTRVASVILANNEILIWGQDRRGEVSGCTCLHQIDPNVEISIYGPSYNTTNNINGVSASIKFSKQSGLKPIKIDTSDHDTTVLLNNGKLYHWGKIATNGSNEWCSGIDFMERAFPGIKFKDFSSTAGFDRFAAITENNDVIGFEYQTFSSNSTAYSDVLHIFSESPVNNRLIIAVPRWDGDPLTPSRMRYYYKNPQDPHAHQNFKFKKIEYGEFNLVGILENDKVWSLGAPSLLGVPNPRYGLDSLYNPYIETAQGICSGTITSFFKDVSNSQIQNAGVLISDEFGTPANGEPFVWPNIITSGDDGSETEYGLPLSWRSKGITATAVDCGGSSNIWLMADGTVDFASPGVAVPTDPAYRRLPEGITFDISYNIKTISVGDSNVTAVSKEGRAYYWGVEQQSFPAQTIKSFSSNKIILNWSEIVGATGYKIYRGITNNISHLTLIGQTSSDYFFDTSPELEGNTFYYYSVKSSCVLGDSDFSDIKYGYISLAPLPPPTGLSASQGTTFGGVELTWNPVPGAKAYKIYRADQNFDSESDSDLEIFDNYNNFPFLRYIGYSTTTNFLDETSKYYKEISGIPINLHSYKIKSSWTTDSVIGDGISLSDSIVDVDNELIFPGPIGWRAPFELSSIVFDPDIRDDLIQWEYLPGDPRQIPVIERGSKLVSLPNLIQDAKSSGEFSYIPDAVMWKLDVYSDKGNSLASLDGFEYVWSGETPVFGPGPQGFFDSVYKPVVTLSPGIVGFTFGVPWRFSFKGIPYDRNNRILSLPSKLSTPISHTGILAKPERISSITPVTKLYDSDVNLIGYQLSYPNLVSSSEFVRNNEWGTQQEFINRHSTYDKEFYLEWFGYGNELPVQGITHKIFRNNVDITSGVSFTKVLNSRRYYAIDRQTEYNTDYNYKIFFEIPGNTFTRSIPASITYISPLAKPIITGVTSVNPYKPRIAGMTFIGVTGAAGYALCFEYPWWDNSIENYFESMDSSIWGPKYKAAYGFVFNNHKITKYFYNNEIIDLGGGLLGITFEYYPFNRITGELNFINMFAFSSSFERISGPALIPDLSYMNGSGEIITDSYLEYFAAFFPGITQERIIIHEGKEYLAFSNPWLNPDLRLYDPPLDNFSILILTDGGLCSLNNSNFDELLQIPGKAFSSVTEPDIGFDLEFLKDYTFVSYRFSPGSPLLLKSIYDPDRTWTNNPIKISNLSQIGSMWRVLYPIKNRLGNVDGGGLNDSLCWIQMENSVNCQISPTAIAKGESVSSAEALSPYVWRPGTLVYAGDFFYVWLNPFWDWTRTDSAFFGSSLNNISTNTLLPLPLSATFTAGPQISSYLSLSKPGTFSNSFLNFNNSKVKGDSYVLKIDQKYYSVLDVYLKFDNPNDRVSSVFGFAGYTAEWIQLEGLNFVHSNNSSWEPSLNGATGWDSFVTTGMRVQTADEEGVTPIQLTADPGFSNFNSTDPTSNNRLRGPSGGNGPGWFPGVGAGSSNPYARVGFYNGQTNLVNKVKSPINANGTISGQTLDNMFMIGRFVIDVTDNYAAYNMKVKFATAVGFADGTNRTGTTDPDLRFDVVLQFCPLSAYPGYNPTDTPPPPPTDSWAESTLYEIVQWGDVSLKPPVDLPKGGPNGEVVLYGAGAGAEHICGYFPDLNKTKVICWGDNTYGQCDVPAELQGNAGVTAIAAGGFFNIVLKTDGSILGWGRNNSGPFDSYTGEAADVPSPISSNPFVKITAGRHHGCALRADGSVVCWGRNVENQCNPPSGITFSKIEAGAFHNCGIYGQNNTVICWGDNTHGQCDVPAGLTGVKNITAGPSAYATAALTFSGTGIAWGAHKESINNSIGITWPNSPPLTYPFVDQIYNYEEGKRYRFKVYMIESNVRGQPISFRKSGTPILCVDACQDGTPNPDCED